MKKATTKKLVLTKATVSRLDQSELTRIRGGFNGTVICRDNEDTEHC